MLIEWFTFLVWLLFIVVVTLLPAVVGLLCVVIGWLLLVNSVDYILCVYGSCWDIVIIIFISVCICLLCVWFLFVLLWVFCLFNVAYANDFVVFAVLNVLGLITIRWVLVELVFVWFSFLGDGFCCFVICLCFA